MPDLRAVLGRVVERLVKKVIARSAAARLDGVRSHRVRQRHLGELISAAPDAARDAADATEGTRLGGSGRSVPPRHSGPVPSGPQAADIRSSASTRCRSVRPGP